MLSAPVVIVPMQMKVENSVERDTEKTYDKTTTTTKSEEQEHKTKRKSCVDPFGYPSQRGGGGGGRGRS